MEALLSEIDNLKKSRICCVVEGKKDKAALEYFGIDNIVVLNKALFIICEEIANSNKTVAILTDLDPTGKKRYGYLKMNLTKLGVRIDDRFRNYLFKETQLRQIEGLPRYLSSKEEVKGKHRDE